MRESTGNSSEIHRERCMPLDTHLVLLFPPLCFAPINFCLRQRIQVSVQQAARLHDSQSSCISGHAQICLLPEMKHPREHGAPRVAHPSLNVSLCQWSGWSRLRGQAEPCAHSWGKESPSPLSQGQPLCAHLTSSLLASLSQPHTAPRWNMTAFCLSHIAHSKMFFLHLVAHRRHLVPYSDVSAN